MAVLATHLPCKGDWLVVLEKLGPEDARAFGAEYRIVDGGWRFEVACLQSPIQNYLPDEKSQPVGNGVEDGYCYDIDMLRDSE